MVLEFFSASGYGMRPELKLREVASRYNIEVKFDEFAGKVNNLHISVFQLVENLLMWLLRM